MPRAGGHAAEETARRRRGGSAASQSEPAQSVSYALARRAVLAGVARGQVSAADVCDAHPDLLRAARYYGEVTDRPCPICRRELLTRVTYAYGDELRHASGRARPARTLPALAARFTRIRVYEVEVCRRCGWNHLTETFLIGTAVTAQRQPRPGSRTAPPRRVRADDASDSRHDSRPR